jgi:ABC-type branched-subunit amino acid transport system permease subunit
MDTMADPVGAVGASFIFGALILKLVDFAKYVRHGDANGIVTIVAGWVIGFVAIKLTLATDWSDEIKFGTESLKDLNFGSQLVLAVVATSVAGLLYDVKKAVDNTDSASTPPLIAKAEDSPKGG